MSALMQRASVIVFLVLIPARNSEAQAPPAVAGLEGALTVPVQVYLAMQEIGITSPTMIQAAFQSMSRGMGGAVQIRTSVQVFGTQASEIMGYTLTRHGSSQFFERLAGIVRNAPKGALTTLARQQAWFNQAALYKDAIAQEAQWSTAALRNLATIAKSWAESVRNSGAGGAGAATTANAIYQQMSSLFHRAVTSIATKFNSLVAASAESTLFQVAGFLAIAGYSQSKILEIQQGYVKKLEAMADAADADAFSANVELLIDRLSAKTLVLPEGMTFGNAIDRLAENMKGGGPVFKGILPDQTAVANGARREKPKDLMNLAAKKPGHWFWPVPVDNRYYRKTYKWFEENGKLPIFHFDGGISSNTYVYQTEFGLIAQTGGNTFFLDWRTFKTNHKLIDKDKYKNSKDYTNWEKYQNKENKNAKSKIIYWR